MKGLFAVLAAVVLLSVVMTSPAGATPVLARPDLFQIEQFAQFNMPPLASFGLQISDGSNGFPNGLLVTTGPTQDRDKLLRISPSGLTSVFASGLQGCEGLTFARGAYGTGLLVSETGNGRLLRAQPNSSRTVLSTGFTQPTVGLGPAQLTYGPDSTGTLSEVLYATDLGSGTIKRVDPSGTTTVFATIGYMAKGITPDLQGIYGGGFIASRFNRNINPYTGEIYHVSASGVVTTITTGVTGVQLLSTGNAMAFQGALFPQINALIHGKVFVPSVGLGACNDGTLSLLNSDGTLSLFASGLDCTTAVFDTTGVLGGGMFVTDVDGPNNESTIYHITALGDPPTAVPEPAGALSLGVGLLGILTSRRALRRGTKQ